MDWGGSGLGWGIGDRGLGSGIRIGDWRLILGIGIEIGNRDCVMGFEIGDWYLGI